MISTSNNIALESRIYTRGLYSIVYTRIDICIVEEQHLSITYSSFNILFLKNFLVNANSFWSMAVVVEVFEIQKCLLGSFDI